MSYRYSSSSREAQRQQNNNNNNNNNNDEATVQTAILTLTSLIQTYILPTLPPPLSTMTTTLLTILNRSEPLISSSLSLLSSSLRRLLNSNVAGNPDATSLVSVLTILFTLYMTVKLMNYIRRTIMGWIWFGVKMGLFLVLVQSVVYVNAYGLEKFVKDMSWWGGIVWGFLDEVVGTHVNDQGNNSGRMPRGMRSRDGYYGGGGRGGGGGYGQVPVQRPAGGRTRWS